MTHESRYHYALVARAIAEIDAADGPVGLEALAAKLQISPAHFQRVFSAWAGVSPKRYQQYLALGFAKERLAAQSPLLDTAAAANLSGTGRLHDLFLRWEGMTPGDYARGGAGLVLHWAQVDTPFGPATAIASARGLCALSFDDAPLPGFAARWPQADLRPAADDLGQQVAAQIAGKPGLTLAPMGGPFQIKVWQALLEIPEGALATYARIAAHIGAPEAHRAVGTAIGQNPLAYLIPCHRVIRKDGGLGGYAWGLTRKRAMLAFEAARHDAQNRPFSDG